MKKFALLVVVGIPLSILLRGWVLQSYWEWFFIPLGAPVINFWHALGGAALFSYLTLQPPDGKAEALKSAQCERLGVTDSGGAFILAHTVIISLTMLGLGWVFKALAS